MRITTTKNDSDNQDGDDDERRRAATVDNMGRKRGKPSIHDIQVRTISARAVSGMKKQVFAWRVCQISQVGCLRELPNKIKQVRGSSAERSLKTHPPHVKQHHLGAKMVPKIDPGDLLARRFAKDRSQDASKIALESLRGRK